MIAAHPFRGFLLFGITQLRMDVHQASQRAIFQYMDGLEIFNCKLTDAENQMARQVAEHLGLLGIAGSDAHRLDEVGRCVTILERKVGSESELISELRAGRFTTEFRRS
jgi:predicted metal-dependent phosphoesterase TrpH